ncbi:hypothetical protein [Sulfurihydrogenibium sp.]|nr:hypothetical protein [Sulfurihydrogenibium sp.]
MAYLLLLYNPHGSDGTWDTNPFIHSLRVFITHTVQMEPTV